MLYLNRGDVAAVDFTTGDFVADGAYHNLDLSGIVPINTVLVNVRLILTPTAANQKFSLMTGGYTNEKNVETVYSQVIGVVVSQSVCLAVDGSRVIQYKRPAGAFNFIAFLVKGWFI